MAKAIGPTRIVPFGDAALLVILGDRLDSEINERVHRQADAIRQLAAADRRFGQPIPAYATILVPIDPIAASSDDLIAPLADVLQEADRRPVESDHAAASRRHELPTHYGGDGGPDLAEIATRHGLRVADVVELHASVEYRVYMLGFAPGFAYLGRVPDEIATPRRAEPRSRVPAGSVGIARDQTGVYPFDTPAGWNIIGRTDAVLWDINREPPALLAPGDRVRFVPIRR